MGFTRYFRRRYWDDERAREMSAHIDIEIDENLAGGMTREDARAAALRKFGNPTLVREDIYQMNTIAWLESVWQDLRYAARVLRGNPGFASVAIVSLALGIGANTAMFQLLDVVRLRNLPVENPQELVEIRIAEPRLRSGSFTGGRPELTYFQWKEIEARQEAFSGMFAWSNRRFNLATGGEVRRANGVFVTGGFFEVLGVAALQGRVFTVADDRPGCAPAAVVSHAFWQREFGGRPVEGQAVTLDRQRFDIIGVTPPSFFGIEVGRRFDIAIPVCAEPMIAGEESAMKRRNSWWLAAIGRLKPGWTATQASAHLATVSAGIFESTLPEVYRAEEAKGYRALKLTTQDAANGVSALRTQYSTPLVLLLTMTGLVLLIACGNLANILLARASAREREIAVRLAIGASRRRIVRQLLAESVLLAALGALLAVLLAGSLSGTLVRMLETGSNQVFLDLSTDWRVLAFTAGLGLATCLVFGLMPAVRATEASPVDAMKAGGRASTAGGGRLAFRRVLVVSQVALTLVLLVGAFLFARSFQNLTRIDLGFDRDGVLVADIDLPGYPADRRQALSQQVLERLRATPGVESVAQTAVVPLAGFGANNNVTIEGEPVPDKKPLANFNWVSPGYFATVKQPIVEGRDFSDRDTAAAPRVAIVTEMFVRRLLRGREPIGARFREGAEAGQPEPVYEIVGVVRDSKYFALREEETPIVFLPTAQSGTGVSWFPAFLVRGASPSLLAAPVKQAIVEVNPQIDIQFSVLKTQISDSLVRERLMALLSSGFGALAVLLSVIGVYGVMSYRVVQRRNEIGIRLALGATRGMVMRMVVREASVLLAVGLIVGAALALAVTRTAKALLFGLEPNDPQTLALALGALTVVGLAAAFLPAHRAARLEPLTALREP